MPDLEVPAIGAGFAKMLACPACHSSLTLTQENLVCRGSSCGLAFAIKDGVPMLRLDMALTEGGAAR